MPCLLLLCIFTSERVIMVKFLKKLFPKKYLGRHVLCNFEGCFFEDFDDVDFMRSAMELAVKKASMHIRVVAYEKFEPQGITMVIILSESHLIIHTWPERGAAAIDCFTCGDEGNPHEAIRALAGILRPKKISRPKTIYR